MAIIDVLFDYEVEHRPKRARKNEIIRVSEIFPVEILELSASDAPVAAIKREVGKPEFVYRLVDNRLFRRANDDQPQRNPIFHIHQNLPASAIRLVGGCGLFCHRSG